MTPCLVLQYYSETKTHHFDARHNDNDARLRQYPWKCFKLSPTSCQRIFKLTLVSLILNGGLDSTSAMQISVHFLSFLLTFTAMDLLVIL
jgi:hypothetical protein